jgi:hypothetical protein
MEWYVGLDVHSKRSVYVIEGGAGRVVARGDIPTTPAGFRQLRRQHELPGDTPVALETGTVAFYAARELARVGLRPIVIDAHEVRVKAHRPRQKSDRRDAFELCEGLRRGLYRAIVHVPPARIGALRETLSRRRHFVAVPVAEVSIEVQVPPTPCLALAGETRLDQAPRLPGIDPHRRLPSRVSNVVAPAAIPVAGAPSAVVERSRCEPRCSSS